MYITNIYSKVFNLNLIAKIFSGKAKDERLQSNSDVKE